MDYCVIGSGWCKHATSSDIDIRNGKMQYFQSLSTDGSHDEPTHKSQHVEGENTNQSKEANSTQGVHIKIPKSQYKPQIKRKKYKKFCYFKVKLSEPMLEVLNLGLKFSILPKKLDITKSLSDFKTFERILISREYLNGKDNVPKNPIFISKKTSL